MQSKSLQAAAKQLGKILDVDTGPGKRFTLSGLALII